ncbi:response regulator transcription factor [Caldilinea sp.]|uniref:response regulator transcription factor n=1 Tax=Caldilinea sp. TaxID=2293560 RepID=UPI002BAC7230|nr:response regulator transcription factor [Anaerolineales bacterium]HQY90342.1 response regulator transcription factor [Caldilinea sp.]
MDTTILIVDDEPNIVELNRMYLEGAGYRVLAARTGQEALARFHSDHPDLLVLDLMLPGADGWTVCREVRRESQTPIIMLTARTEDIDRILGLELGADDYVTKPYNPRELVARVRAVLRRTNPPAEASITSPLHLGNLMLDPARRTASVGEKEITLRSKEFDLLHHLMENAGIVLTRERLLSQVWGYDFAGETRTVDVHVAALRRELRVSDVSLETVWGVGYKLVGPPSPSAGAR